MKSFSLCTMIFAVVLLVGASEITEIDDDTEVKFVWTVAAGYVDHYNVYVSTDKGEYVLMGITSETSYTVEGSDGHSYKIKVEAVDAAGNIGPMSEESDMVTVMLPSYIDITVLLEGPYKSDKTMKTVLTIPKTSPYTDARMVETIPANAVDWVFVELRSDKTTKVRGESMFLLSDGSIVRKDGDTKMEFSALTPGDYYLIIRHRNHLAIMSKFPVSFVQFGDSVAIDLTVKNNVGGENSVKEVSPGIFGMYAGDIDHDGEITTSDFEIWFNLFLEGVSGYNDSDMDLDGETTTADFELWYNNFLLGPSFEF